MNNTRLYQIKDNVNLKIQKLRKQAKDLKQNISLLYRAYKHSDTPWYAKIVAIITMAYALSPIDLIPDFIPVLGYLDDLLIVPAGIALSLRLIPKDIIEECRQMTGENKDMKGKGIFAAVIIILLWVWIISLFLMFLNII